MRVRIVSDSFCTGMELRPDLKRTERGGQKMRYCCKNVKDK